MSMNRVKPIAFLRDVTERILQILLPEESEVSAAEVNWSNFVRSYAGDWHGTRAVYASDGALLESSSVRRNFKFEWRDTYDVPISYYPFRPVLPVSIPDLDTVFEQSSLSQNGRQLERQYRLNRLEHSDSSGVYHPRLASQQGLFLANGVSAWAPSQVNLEPQGRDGLEITLRQGSCMVSVGLLFSAEGKISSLTLVRESIGDASLWSQVTELPVQPIATEVFSGKFSGQELTVYTPIEFSSSELTIELSNDWVLENSSVSQNRIFAFPEGVYVRFPVDVNASVERLIEVLWSIDSLTTASPLVYRASLCYTPDGQLRCLSGGAFTQING